MFYLKTYRASGVLVAAICDKGLLGKEFREGEVVLRVSRSYYGGDLVGEEKIRSVLSEADIISLVGENCIAISVEEGYGDWRYVKRVDGVPHLNIYRL